MNKRTKGRIPTVITCVNCGHRMLSKDYIGVPPNEDTPPDHIHISYNQHIPHYTVMCTCGHFMINDQKKTNSKEDG